MIEARRAVVGDAGELVRLRGVMLAGMSGRFPAPGRWQAAAARTLTERLADPADLLAAYVVDRPDRPAALAACAVGVIECRLAGPDNPTGEVGYVFNVATDPEYRRRGYSRACLEGLLGWYWSRGVATVDLKASAQGEPLYRALGFAPTSSTTMRLSRASAQPPGRGAQASPSSRFSP